MTLDNTINGAYYYCTTIKHDKVCAVCYS